MNVLNKIIGHKREEVEAIQKQIPLSQLHYYPDYSLQVPSFSKALTAEGAKGLIAEFKRASPSKGLINLGASVAEIAAGYEKAGASALSVLTDRAFFKGHNQDLVDARRSCSLPILRKEFIIDAYQIYEAKALGASAILLIGSVLSKSEILEFSALADALGMEVLYEIHHPDELEKINSYIKMVGVNSRDLTTFEVNIEHALRVIHDIGVQYLPIAESGVTSAYDYLQLHSAGYRGFLIGELFMKTASPALACEIFCSQVASELNLVP